MRVDGSGNLLLNLTLHTDEPSHTDSAGRGEEGYSKIIPRPHRIVQDPTRPASNYCRSGQDESLSDKNSTRIQLVLFDLGGVLLKWKPQDLITHVSRLVNITEEEIKNIVDSPDLLYPFELGHISPQEYFNRLIKILPLSWTYEEFIPAWNSVLSENKDLTKIIPVLKEQCKVGALSNTNALHVEYVIRTVPALGMLDKIIASCEVGLRKPDPKIYDLAIKTFGVSANESIYIDDRVDFVEAARDCGIKSIYCKKPSQVISELSSLGLRL